MDESRPLLSQATPPQQPPHPHDSSRRDSHLYDGDVESLLSSHLSKSERRMHATAVGERLPYNNYTTIDWLHDLVKNSVRHSALRCAPGLGARIYTYWDAAEGWVAAALVGMLTACVAAVVDVSVAAVADWKEGYCSRSWHLDREGCCDTRDGVCPDWISWGSSWTARYAIYVALALAYGIIAGGVTMTTRACLPSVERGARESQEEEFTETTSGKTMFMAAGSGIPEIKTILSGFVIPHFLDFKVLVVKAVGSTFAVGTGMCLGKEGPFVHISTCVGYLVAKWLPKYRENDMKMREMLSIACSAGLSVAFGAPIGGVLFSYEVGYPYHPPGKPVSQPPKLLLICIRR